MLLVIGLISLANIVSGARLVIDLVNEEGIRDAERLLLTGGSIWLTNVIVFSLWYWQFDRGGPIARAVTPTAVPDFLFPQMDVNGARATRLAAGVRRLPVPVVHQRDGVQSHRRDADVALDEDRPCCCSHSCRWSSPSW